MVPAKNGTIPDAPEGEHSSQFGTLFELAAVPGADEPPHPDCPDDGTAEGVDRAETTPPPEPTPGETPARELLDPAAAFDGVLVPGNVTAPYGFVRPVPAMLEIWAAAGPPSTMESLAILTPAGSVLHEKNGHPEKDDNKDGDRIFDQLGKPDPRSTVPLKFGIDRRHSLPRLLKNQRPAIA